MGKLFKKEIGITLVALVITIIILLILAGIAISQLTDSGLFQKSKMAKDVAKNAQEDEETRLEGYSDKIDSIIGISTRNAKTSKLINNISFAISGESSNDLSYVTVSVDNSDAARIYYVYINGEICGAQFGNNVIEKVGTLSPATTYTVKCGVMDKEGGILESKEKTFTTTYETKKAENGPITELYYGGDYYTALTYGECNVKLKSISCKLQSGNPGASLVSTITGYLYGYTGEEWELLESRSVTRPKYTKDVTIFDEEFTFQNNEKIYTNFELRLQSTDNERYSYAELKPSDK